MFAAHLTSGLVSLSVEELSTGLPVLPPACFHLFSDFYLGSFTAGWVSLGPKAGSPVGFVEEVVSGGRQENQWVSWDLPLSPDSLVLNFFSGGAVAWYCHWLQSGSETELPERPNPWCLGPPEAAGLLQSCYLHGCCTLFLSKASQTFVLADKWVKVDLFLDSATGPLCPGAPVCSSPSPPTRPQSILP